MKVDSLLKESKKALIGDKVNALIQKELWPLLAPLEVQTRSGVVHKRDKDGSVLKAVQAKSLELVDQYGGDKKEAHKGAILAATDYKEVIRLMTNVLLYNVGLGVAK